MEITPVGIFHSSYFFLNVPYSQFWRTDWRGSIMAVMEKRKIENEEVLKDLKVQNLNTKGFVWQGEQLICPPDQNSLANTIQHLEWGSGTGSRRESQVFLRNLHNWSSTTKRRQESSEKSSSTAKSFPKGLGH